MRYRFRLWSASFPTALFGPPKVVVETIYRWRWLALLHAFPYYFGPRHIIPTVHWTVIDPVVLTVVNGREVWSEVDRHSTELTRTTP